jgi:hypothetical protein
MSDNVVYPDFTARRAKPTLAGAFPVPSELANAIAEISEGTRLMAAKMMRATPQMTVDPGPAPLLTFIDDAEERNFRAYLKNFLDQAESDSFLFETAVVDLLRLV